jgi:HEPN domain-containing protein
LARLEALGGADGARWPALDAIDTIQREHLSSWIDEFRNTADQDYIAARSLYRATLHTQAAWSAVQALEKYFKAILLFSCQSVKEYKDHNLIKLLETAQKLPHLNVRIPDDCLKLLELLNDEGSMRASSKRRRS